MKISSSYSHFLKNIQFSGIEFAVIDLYRRQCKHSTHSDDADNNQRMRIIYSKNPIWKAKLIFWRRFEQKINLSASSSLSFLLYCRTLWKIPMLQNCNKIGKRKWKLRKSATSSLTTILTEFSIFGQNGGVVKNDKLEFYLGKINDAVFTSDICAKQTIPIARKRVPARQYYWHFVINQI